MTNKIMTYDEWDEHTSDVLWEEAKRQELNHIDELNPQLVVQIRHRMAEEWIAYKARTGQLELAT